MAEKIVESNLELNVLLQHWPDEVAHAFRRFSAEARKKKTALTQEQLEQCAASLERTFPFLEQAALAHRDVLAQRLALGLGKG